MKVLDLFSGIGGFSLGLERAGFETMAFCEIDEHCHKVLKKHWPQIPIVDNVEKLNGYTLQQILGRIDVICGGFPCTDISVAGKQKGLKDESGNATRSGLWFQYKRIIGEIQPRYVIIENVANLRSNGLVTVLQDLWSLGYDAEWHIISAKAIGACHLRERIWIIAYPNRNRSKQSLPLQTRDEGKSLLPGGIGEKGEIKSSNSNRTGLESSRAKQFSARTKRRSSSETSKEIHSSSSDRERLERFGKSSNASEVCTQETINARIMRALSEQQWLEATSDFRSWWEIESDICRVDDGISAKLDTPERVRKERIKQLGNSIVPQIAELIGKSILEFEKGINHES